MYYCGAVARGPDAEAAMQQPDIGTETRRAGAFDDDASPATPRTSRNYWGKEQVIDERLDPYSARDYTYTREPRNQELKDVLANEEAVERIVRMRTWKVLADRCANMGSAEVDWEREFSVWRQKAGKK
ncbi:hypothetical protein MRB53_040386 [Persea americana]|nr:hypothetical protein MRB53_040386 [Persea americana]